MNVGVASTEAPYVLLLNPDTEIIEGTLDRLVAVLDSQADVALVGVRQVGPDGELQYTIRRFPSVARWLGESSARNPGRFASPSWASEPCHARRTSSPAGVIGRQARSCWRGARLSTRLRRFRRGLLPLLRGAGPLPAAPSNRVERRASSRADRRTSRGERSLGSRHAAQLAYAKRIYMRKHCSGPRRVGGLAALVVGYGIRALVGGRDGSARGGQRANARAALATLVGLRDRPFRPAVPAR